MHELKAKKELVSLTKCEPSHPRYRPLPKHRFMERWIFPKNEADSRLSVSGVLQQGVLGINFCGLILTHKRLYDKTKRRERSKDRHQ